MPSPESTDKTPEASYLENHTPPPPDFQSFPGPLPRNFHLPDKFHLELDIVHDRFFFSLLPAAELVIEIDIDALVILTLLDAKNVRQPCRRQFWIAKNCLDGDFLRLAEIYCVIYYVITAVYYVIHTDILTMELSNGLGCFRSVLLPDTKISVLQLQFAAKQQHLEELFQRQLTFLLPHPTPYFNI